MVYVEAPIVHSYKNRGMSDAEIMAAEEDEPKTNLPSWMPSSVGSLLGGAKKKAGGLFSKKF